MSKIILKKLKSKQRMALACMEQTPFNYRKTAAANFKTDNFAAPFQSTGAPAPSTTASRLCHPSRIHLPNYQCSQQVSKDSTMSVMMNEEMVFLDHELELARAEMTTTKKMKNQFVKSRIWNLNWSPKKIC